MHVVFLYYDRFGGLTLEKYLYEVIISQYKLREAASQGKQARYQAC